MNASLATHRSRPAASTRQYIETRENKKSRVDSSEGFCCSIRARAPPDRVLGCFMVLFDGMLDFPWDDVVCMCVCVCVLSL